MVIKKMIIAVSILLCFSHSVYSVPALSPSFTGIVQEVGEYSKIMTGVGSGIVVYTVFQDCMKKKFFKEHSLDKNNAASVNEDFKEQLLTRIKNKSFVLRMAGAGTIVAACSRLGNAPKFTLNDIKYPLLLSMGTIGLASIGVLKARYDALKSYCDHIKTRRIVESHLRATGDLTAYSLWALSTVGISSWIIYQRYLSSL